MPERPLLIFPFLELASRKKKTGYPSSGYHYPTTERQAERLSPKFETVEKAFEARRAELIASPTGAIPEQVLVLETIGKVEDFIRAVQAVPGLEWMAEWDEDDIPPDEDFFVDEEHKEKKLSGRLYLLMTNQRALGELLSMWQHYIKNPLLPLPYGRARWKQIFQMLKDIRPWGIQDRLIDTGILNDWKSRIAAGAEHARFEIEFWYKENDEARGKISQQIASLLSEKSGRLIKEVIISEIRYHAVLAELPSVAITEALHNHNTRLISCDQVMFFRPTGQALIALPVEDPTIEAMPHKPPPSNPIPVAALLDGLPLGNHTLLSGRLVIDDPDNWGEDYQPNERVHGTSMASLIIHDELDLIAQPLNRLLYVRPIMRPDRRGWNQIPEEFIPEEELPVDIVHRAVRRMFDGESGEPPVAPHVKIINLSVGDLSRPFISYPSPWARLLDWLAWKYNVLFIVSAGNYANDIVLNVDRQALSTLTSDQLKAETICSLFNDCMNRRILSPAESMNALTVAGCHVDNSPNAASPALIDPYSAQALPSPINAMGLGFRRSIKPEVLFKSGRQLYQEKMGNTHSNATLQILNSTLPPGIKAASPGRTPGDLSSTRHYRGTSNATALTTRVACQLYDVLKEIQQEYPAGTLSDDHIPLLIKSLLVHGASWGETLNTLKEIIRPVSQAYKIKENMSRFTGYGVINQERVFSCTEQRATLIGCGSINNDEAHVYSIPLPPSLSGQKTWRRLVVTLVWFTPINPKHRGYRRAALSFEPTVEQLEVIRQEADYHAVKRGTVHHEVFEGDNATAFVDGDTLQIRTVCRADAGDLSDAIPYALSATIEVAQSVAIPIYDEIRTRVRTAITLQSSVP